MNFDLVVAGVGGQGVLSIAWVLDHAAHAAGWRLKQSEVHGMAQRGGAVSAFVRLSDRPVDSDLIAAGSACAHRLGGATGGAALHRPAAPGRRGGDRHHAHGQHRQLSLTRVRCSRCCSPCRNLVAVDATRLAHAAGTVKAQNTVVLGAAAPLLPLPAGRRSKRSCRPCSLPRATASCRPTCAPSARAAPPAASCRPCVPRACPRRAWRG